MQIHVTAEDIERASRLSLDPYDSENVWHTIYPKPVANDDRLFNHRGEYMPCSGCQPEPVTGEGTWAHGHIVVEGSNGGVRCEPLTDDSFRRFVRDVLYPTPETASIRIVQDAERGIGLAVFGSGGLRTLELPLSASEAAADALARDGVSALDRLIAANRLFEDSPEET